MGSGNNNRKKSDTTIIRLPKATLGISATAGGSIEKIAELCVPSFEILIKPHPLVKKGVKVDLSTAGSAFIIFISGVEIGKLNDAQSKMVKKCSELGVVYRGEIVTKGEKNYARFIRSAK